MPTRKKTVTKSALESSTKVDPTVAETLGRLESRLDGQEQTDTRIENTLSQLMRDHNEERKNSAVQFGELGKQVAKIGVVLEESVKSNKAIIENQNHMIGKMNDISKDGELQKLQYMEFRKVVEEHFAFSSKWTATVEERLHKLETTKYVWYTIGGLVMALLCAASYIATVLGVFKK